MKIDSYKFGEIIIDGKQYNSDLIIFPQRIFTNWWRKEGHSLCVEDLKEVLKDKPEILIIGCGAMGVMKVPKNTVDYLNKQKIEVKIYRTKEACETYNTLSKIKKVSACLHLTC